MQRSKYCLRCVGKCICYDVSNTTKEDETTSFPGHKFSPALAETGLRGPVRDGLTNHPSISTVLTSGIVIPAQ